MSLQGYPELMRRFAAVKGAAGAPLMATLGVAAVREQKLLFAPHTKTGTTVRSIRLVSASPNRAITAVGFAGPFIEFGTKAHDITPKAAKALAWAQGAPGGPFRRLSGATRKGVKGGNMIFAMKVHHPGTRPDPFMVPGALLALKGAGLASTITKAWNL